MQMFSTLFMENMYEMGYFALHLLAAVLKNFYGVWFCLFPLLLTFQSEFTTYKVHESFS